MENREAVYHCPVCGATLETCKHWGPICGKHGRRVCAACCYGCENHIGWSGIWQCSFADKEQRRVDAMKRIADRFDSENRKASRAYYNKRREEARAKAVKAAKAKKK